MQTTAIISSAAGWWHKTAPRFLVASWFLGIALGCLAANASAAILVELIRSSIGTDLSIIGALTVAVLPFLLSAFAISFDQRWLLLLISIGKAFSFSYCAWGVCLAFGQSGWLVLILFLFTDLFLVPLLYFYWLQHIRGDRTPKVWELPVFLAAAIAIACIDHRFVAPFLTTLM